jgi:hypothetical protein
MDWKKMEVRGPKARYACVDQFRVITMRCYVKIIPLLIGRLGGVLNGLPDP